MAELQRGEGILHLDRGQDRDSSAGQRDDHAVERLAKVLPKSGRQCHLKTHQRINHQSFRADPFDGIENLLRDLIRKKDPADAGREFPIFPFSAIS